MKGKDDGKEDLAKAFSGPRIKTIFGTLGPPSTGKDGSSDMRRVEASDRVERIASRKFDILESRFDEAGIYLKIKREMKGLEERFEYVRVKLQMLGFFPRLADQGPNLYLTVYPLPKRKRRSNKANVIMLALTIFTTVWAGSILWTTRSTEIDTLSGLFRSLLRPMDVLMGGLTFALPLLLILGTHELSHYFMARRYRIDSSLPYFIPIPPFISPIGTFGALISMKEPLSTRKSLVDIGAAGPIAGFIVAIPVTIIGLVLTHHFPVASELVAGNIYIMINPPLLFWGLQEILGVSTEGVLYPTAFAGWIGLFVTALNLLPVGQLDGGHIARGALGDKAKYVSTGTLILMVILGFTTGFLTYLLFAVLILFLGARHPPPLNDISPLSKRQYVTTGIAVVIMVLTFHPVPLESMEIEDQGVELVHHRDRYFVSPEAPNMEMFELVNKGEDLDKVSIHVRIDGEEILMSATNTTMDVNMTAYSTVLGNNPSLFTSGDHYVMLLGPRQFEMQGGSRKGIQLVFGCSYNVEYENSTEVLLSVRTVGGESHVTSFSLVRAEHFMEADVQAGEGSALVTSRVWMLRGQTENSTVSVKVLHGPPEVKVRIRPLTGNWSIKDMNISMEASWRYEIGNISWTDAGGRVGNASFAMVVEPVVGDLKDLEVQISINGPEAIVDDIEVMLGRYMDS